MDKNKISSRYQRTLEVINTLGLHNTTLKLQKGDTFIDYGEKTKRIGIVLQGLLYASYLSDNGTEWISRFFYAPLNFIVSNHAGFYFGRNSTECIRAYEDSEIIVIEKETFKQLLDTNRDFERTVRILAEESYIHSMDRIHAFQSLNAKQRIRKFLNENPELGKKLQRQHMASYLGIHRNILSRFLSKI